MSKQIGAREISEYAQKYNMPLGKDTPLSMEWCFEMSDKAYNQALEDTLETLKVWEDSKEKFIEYLETRIEVQKKITD